MQAEKRKIIFLLSFCSLFVLVAWPAAGRVGFFEGNSDTERPGQGSVWTAQVVSLADGDSFQVRRNGKTLRVRLHGIDSPELRQSYGRAALQAARHLLAGREVVLQTVSRDSYGRVVALVWADGRLVNCEMVRCGAAWMYPHFCKFPSLCGEWARLQDEARSARLGLWQEPDPAPPWAWRKKHPRERW